MSRRAQEHTYSEIICVGERAFKRSLRMAFDPPESRHFRRDAEPRGRHSEGRVTPFLRSEGVRHFICRDTPFLPPISWHSFGLNSCARRTAAALLHASSFTLVPDARPSGFGTPGKDFNLSQHRLTKSCRSPQKSTPCCLGAAQRTTLLL